MPFNSYVFLEAWKDFRKHRTKLKKPMSDYTEQLDLKKLVNLSGGNEEKAIRIIRQSIDNGWRGLFELKNEPKQEATKERRTDYDSILIKHYNRQHGGMG